MLKVDIETDKLDANKSKNNKKCNLINIIKLYMTEISTEI